MDNLHIEISELKQFVADLKADRAAAKEKEKKEAWTKYVSLTVVVLAVMGSIGAQWGGKYGSGTQMNQAKASDAWSAYQAESIKEHLYNSARMQAAHNPGGAETAQQQKVATDKMADYEKKKQDWSDKANGFEKARDTSSRKGGFMGTAISFYSMAIAMTSICLVTKKKPLWFLSMGLAGVALAEMIYAWNL